MPPASREARADRSRTAGLRCRSARRDTGTMWFDSAAASGNTHRSPAARRGGRRPLRSRAAAPPTGRRSTASSATSCTGAASIGLRIRRVLERGGRHRVAPPRIGIGGGDRAERATTAPRSRARCPRPTRRARRGWPSRATSTGAARSIRPAAISARGRISSAGESVSSGVPPATGSSSSTPAMRPRRSRYFASPPQTRATSTAPSRIAVARTREQRLLQHTDVGDDRARAGGADPPGRPPGRGRGRATCRAARAPCRPPTSSLRRAARRRPRARPRRSRGRRPAAPRAGRRRAGARRPRRRGRACGGRAPRRRAYLRWKFGVRFSANAFGPSFESSDPMTAPV